MTLAAHAHTQMTLTARAYTQITPTPRTETEVTLTSRADTQISSSKQSTQGLTHTALKTHHQAAVASSSRSNVCTVTHSTFSFVFLCWSPRGLSLFIFFTPHKQLTSHLVFSVVGFFFFLLRWSSPPLRRHCLLFASFILSYFILFPQHLKEWEGQKIQHNTTQYNNYTSKRTVTSNLFIFLFRVGIPILPSAIKRN